MSGRGTVLLAAARHRELLVMLAMLQDFISEEGDEEMTKTEAEKLANHITLWSANDQLINHNAGLKPEVKQIGNNSWVVFLPIKIWYVWSWQEWKRDFEPGLVLEPEEEIEA